LTRSSLGNKLQRLAALSPPHVHAVELLVDRILKRWKTHQIPRPKGGPKNRA
jgi:hypothetical protein